METGGPKEVWHARHRGFLLVLFLFTAFRVFALLLYRPGGYIYDFSDFLSYLSFAQLSDQGYYPYVHYWMEYPPLFPWLAVALYRLSLAVPPWVDPRLVYYTILGLGLLPFAVGSLAMVYLLGLRLGDRRSALTSTVIYALLFAPAYVATGHFDHMPTFFLLLGLLFLVRGRDWPAGLAIGLGFMSKLTPALLLPLGLRSLEGWGARARLLAASLAVGLAVLAPFLLINPDMVIASFRSMVGRASWETPWALMEGYFGYGVVAGDRFDPGITDFANHASAVPWLLVTAAFAAVYLFIYTRRIDWSDARRQIAFAGLSVVLFLLYSKGYSPQFAIMLAPFAALLLPNWRGVAYLLLIDVSNLFVAQLYYIMFPSHPWIMGISVGLRTLLFVALGVEFGAQLFDWTGPRWIHGRRWAAAIIAGAAVVIWAAAGARMASVYGQERLAAEPLRPVIEAILTGAKGSGAVVLVDDHELYRRLYPFIGSKTDVYVATGPDRARELASGHGVAWVVATEGDAGAQEWLAGEAELVRKMEAPSAVAWEYDILDPELDMNEEAE